MLNIITYPNPILRKIAEPVDDVDENIRQLIEEMEETMYADDGVGLAAPQVSVSKQIIVTDAGDGLFHLINPKINFLSDELIRVRGG